MPLTFPQIMVILGLLAIVSELFIGINTGFDLVVIGSILVMGGFSGILTHSMATMLIVCIILSITYIAFGRQAIKHKLIVLTHKTNIDKLIGKEAKVVRSITPDTPGLVRLDDEDWRATSTQVIYEKDRVVVLGVEGVSLVVKKL